jgi:mannose-1-phosphate guanylyltransferase
MPQPVALIMAGGRGQRFWPLSTEARPKQFLDLEQSGRTLLQTTVDRVLPLVGSPDRLFVASGTRYLPLIREQLPELPDGNLLVEPEARDSAPAIALSALRIQERLGDVTMGVFSSDHRVEDGDAFRQVVQQAVHLAERERGLVSIGVTPTRPATGYGYVERGAAAGSGFKVARFVEKPNRAKAEAYVRGGQHLWNAGMFVWPVEAILTELRTHAADLMTPLDAAFSGDRVDEAFGDLPKISIDYAVMERTERAFVVEGDFGWDDIGDWAALERLLPAADGAGGAIFGPHAGHDAHGNIVYTDGADDVLVAYGVSDLVIVKRGDTVLVLPKSRVGDIKAVLEDERLRDWVP